MPSLDERFPDNNCFQVSTEVGFTALFICTTCGCAVPPLRTNLLLHHQWHLEQESNQVSMRRRLIQLGGSF